jgi:uncharacterized protein (TIGR02285 family)
MRKQMKRVLAVSILGAIGFGSSVVADDAIEIIYESRPPYVQSGSDGLEGFVATPLMGALKDSKVAYEIKEKPSKRHLHEIEANQKEICAVGWFKNPDREKFANFTDPLYQDKPMGILARKAQMQKDLTLDALFANSSLSVLTKASYSYGALIDEKLKNSALKKREVNSDNIKMLALIEKKRADFMFISFEEASYLLQDQKVSVSLEFVPLVGMPEGNKRYLICSKKVPQEKLDAISKHIK